MNRVAPLHHRTMEQIVLQSRPPARRSDKLSSSRFSGRPTSPHSPHHLDFFIQGRRSQLVNSASVVPLLCLLLLLLAFVKSSVVPGVIPRHQQPLQSLILHYRLNPRGRPGQPRLLSSSSLVGRERQWTACSSLNTPSRRELYIPEPRRPCGPIVAGPRTLPLWSERAFAICTPTFG